jgi:spore coat polysaccharide biosynthesis protein SpsF
MKAGVIVFARLMSSRLPGKALLPLGGRPMVGRVIDRARRVRLARGVVLATSTDPADDRLAEFAAAEGVDVYRGPLDNVARRALDCARAHGWTAFARVCGDRPFFGPEDTDRAIACMADGGDAVDLVSGALAGPVPPGLTTEVIRTGALDRMLSLTRDSNDLEHLTRYMYAHPAQFRMAGVAVTGAGEAVRLVVDTEQDLRRARYIVDRLGDPAAADLAEIVRLAQAWDREISEACHA